MTNNHHLALEKLENLHKDNPDVIALIICGSLARKQERDDSDIDCYLVYTNAAFEEVKRNKAFFYGTWNPDAFFGVCIDGKIISTEFLQRAVNEASEPTRASFIDAYPLFTKDPQITSLIPLIAVYPEHDQFRRARAFYSYVKHYRYVGEEAHALGNEFWFRHCVLEFIFFAGRLVLAHNKRLYPCHKAMYREIALCTSLPDNFIGESQALSRSFSLKDMIAMFEKLGAFFSMYEYSDIERTGYILEDEQAWFSGNIHPEHW